jgi:aminomuconate-semialdehyde/2-hydroxymuconate-6-semialdehyde dehydrogenase
VQRSVFEHFVNQFVHHTKQLRLGDPLDEPTEQGALNSRGHLDKVMSYIELARTEGGKVVSGGEPPPPVNDRCANGFFLKPTVITGLTPHCRTNREEIFGPVVTITPFDDESHAIEYANCVEYGLSASIWTRDVERVHRISSAIHAGTVWVNCWMLRDLRVPFGGTKQSGVGREGGDEALRFFTEAKNVCIALNTGKC